MGPERVWASLYPSEQIVPYGSQAVSAEECLLVSGKRVEEVDRNICVIGCGC